MKKVLLKKEKRKKIKKYERIRPKLMLTKTIYR